MQKPSVDSPESLPASSASSDCGFVFSGFRLDPGGTLFRGHSPIHLPPKELAALRLLLIHAGQIVTPHELRQTLWGDVHVSPHSVPRCISTLRARLEPDDCIQTVYKRGYRLTAHVRPYSAASPSTAVRLAIAPFATGFAVPEYLGTAVAEQTAASFARAHNPAISILAQDSVFTLARRGLTAQEIGAALKADLVLAGTLRALPSGFRLRAEMIRVRDAVQVWLEDVLIERDRMAGLETELASRLNFRLNTSFPVSRPERDPAARPRGATALSIEAAAAPQDALPGASEDPNAPRRREAYDMFQRAHHDWQTYERHHMQDALQHLIRATELDPSLTGARVDLVNLCVEQTLQGFMPRAVAASIARRTAAQAPETGLDDAMPPAAGTALGPALGWISFHFDRDLPAALHAFARSAHLPHDRWVTQTRSMFALSRCRFDEAIGLLRAAIEADPFSASLHGLLARALHLTGRAAESVEQAQNALAQFPDHTEPNLYGISILAFNGDHERAVKLAEDFERRAPYYDLAAAVHAYALVCRGNASQARAILERLEWLGRERFVLRAFTPAVSVALGEPDAAIAQLRASMNDRCPWFFEVLADPRLKPLHGHAEFEEMRSLLAVMVAGAEE